ncbi:MAG TPA: TIGR01244 family sulfur transferase [Sphingomonas sp.]|uniref:TIGR01244 family sulfur transferase n=1 Tax=Sphingomonas sp. TaxID=28214 RepID=UPI002C32FF07|nr:TIGR01244 family sulfur transferase [Sphingomonas sp.]HMI18823.1 TIGR01244 family sulfur transferase [Sphingomonas sp.]
MFRTLDPSISVFGQIEPEDVAAAKAQGFTTIVNNRPEGEQPGQPAGTEIEAAAKAAGLDYVAIPVDHSGFADWQVAAMADALETAKGPVLAFCRSGTRSTFLWALARNRLGDDGEALIAKAAGAGYDLSSIRSVLGA